MTSPAHVVTADGTAVPTEAVIRRRAPLWPAALLASWIGAVLFFSAVVAPAAFAVSTEFQQDRALAGAFVGHTLPALLVIGLAIGLLVFLTARREDPPTRRRYVRLVGGASLALACGIAQFVVGPRIEELRGAIGRSLEALPPGDARRATFGRLHGYSVGLLGLGFLAAVVVMIDGLSNARTQIRRTRD